MAVEPPDQPLDHCLFELRETLGDTLIITDVIRELRPSPDAARHLPNLYIQLGTLQRIVRRARRVLIRHIT
jgi:predicted ATPase